jgi:tetratricopeptide (TPR) repeat protein
MLQRSSHLLLALSILVPARAAAQAVAPADATRSDEAFARGVSLHQAGDILGAIEAYNAALRLTPGRLEVRSNLGAAYTRLGRYDEAIEQYRKALGADPGQVAVRFNLALALYKRGRADEAAIEFRKVRERDPGRKPALLLLADCELQMGNDRRVIELLSPEQAALGEDRLFAYLLGTALIRQGELQSGQALVDRLFRSGGSAEAHLLLGAQHLRREDFRGAVPELRQAAELDPDLPTVHSMLGVALMNSGERPAAIPEFQRELAKNPNDFEANLRLGLLLRDEERLQEAMDYVQRAARLRPRHPDVLYGLGRLSLAFDRLEDAQKYLEELTRTTPGFEGGHVMLATVYYRLKMRDLGDKERAIVDKLKAQRKATEAAAQGAADPPATDGKPPETRR